MSESGGRAPGTARAASEEDWPEPDLSLLEDERPDLPAFRVEVLPPGWRPWVEHAAHGASAAVDHVALSLLTTAASLIGVLRPVAPGPSWREPCVLWTALAGPPSSGKTPAVETSVRLLRSLERELAAARETSPHRYSARLRRLTVVNPGLKMMDDAQQHCTGSVLLPRDDRCAWLDEMVRDVAEAGDNSVWLPAWSGGAWTVVRKGKPTIIHECASVCILGTIRPDAVACAFAGADGGIAARFLYAWPRRAAFHPVPGTPEPETLDARAALARIRDIDHQVRDLPLGSDAMSAFNCFRQTHHAGANNLDGREGDWWGKGTGTVLRLAGVLTLLDWAAQPADTPEPAQVPGWAVEAAAGLWQDYLWPHARAVLRPAASASHQLNHRVLRWIRQHRKTEVSREDLRRHALNRACDAARTQRVAKSLERAGWLKPVEIVQRKRGRPPTRWFVNPDLLDGCPA